jgi:hypothetical protein
MLALVEIDYTSKDKFKTLSRDTYNRIREQVVSLNLPEWPETNEQAPDVWLYDKRLIDLTTDGFLLASHGIHFTVKNFKDSYKIKVEDGIVHNHLHVAIPNIGLLSINEVKLLEDACTDNLQRHLEQGWRIVAVCPPNSVRRPDYILGKINP